MAEPQNNAEVAAAIRELARQVDALGNAMVAAAEKIANALSSHDGINVNVGRQPGPW